MSNQKNKDNEYFHSLDQQYYVPTFKRYPLTMRKGKGTKIWDVEGKEYLDVLAGIAVNNLGHCHPRVVKAIQEQAEQLIHCSNFFSNEPQVELSRKLVELSGLDKAFITNSGAESVEGAIKFARKYAHHKNRGGKIISMNQAFHGRTLATIATGQKKYQKGFDPIPEGFSNVPLNNIRALETSIDKETAAIILEPVQGEGGVHPADAEYLQQVRDLCDKNDILLVFDEIQCGMGRTGKLFAKEHYAVQPDIIALAKGLGSGVPIGATLINEKISETIDYGDHGTTFGGNPLVCAAANATLDVLTEGNLLDDVLEKGNWLMKQFSEWEDMHIKEVRGLGLMIGVEFDFETKPLVAEMMEQGVIANATADTVLRIVPPLIIEKQELEHLLNVTRISIKKLKKNDEL